MKMCKETCSASFAMTVGQCSLIGHWPMLINLMHNNLRQGFWPSSQSFQEINFGIYLTNNKIYWYLKYKLIIFMVQTLTALQAKIPKLGELIRSARTSQGVNRTAMARITGINPNSLAKYEKAGEKGGQFPPLATLVKILAFLKLDPRLAMIASAENVEDAIKLVEITALNASDEFFGGIFGSKILEKERQFGVETLHSIFSAFSQTEGEKTKSLEKSPEDDLPSPPSSDPKPTHSNMENDNGQSSE